MSRIVVYDGNGISIGELHADCSRSWAISDGGTAEITLGDPPSWLDLGQFVIVEHESLPAWGGMIDTPWRALPPVTVTAYNAVYFCAIRSPRAAQTLKGTGGEILAEFISQINQQGELYLRAGEISAEDVRRVEIYDMRTFWEQMKGLTQRAGMEMQVRVGTDANQRFRAWLDMAPRLGVDTDYLLHDGSGANMQISDATVDGQIWNSITGISDQATEQSRLTGETEEDEESIGRYRLRSKTVQFNGVTSQSQIEANTLAELARLANPKVYLTVSVLDKGMAFQNLRLGNTLLVHASRLVLPGGARGWKGYARITAMVYNEGANAVELSLEGEL